MSTTRDRNPQALPATALLWDLDNVACPREHLPSLAAALTSLVEPDAPRIAAAHRRTFRASRAVLTGLGVEVWSGGRRRNGADRVLLSQATRLRDVGVERFVVASNDHRFARIATFADLHVLTLTDEYLSVRLRAAARSVTVLTYDGEAWHDESQHCAG